MMELSLTTILLLSILVLLIVITMILIFIFMIVIGRRPGGAFDTHGAGGGSGGEGDLLALAALVNVLEGRPNNNGIAGDMIKEIPFHQRSTFKSNLNPPKK